MYFFYFIAAYLLIIRLNKSIVNFDVKIKWGRKLSLAGAGVIILFLIVQVTLNDLADSFIGCALLLAVLIYIIREPDFNHFKFFVWAHYPLVVVGFIASFAEWIEPVFYDTWDTYFIFAILGAFAWIFARWISSKKQREEVKIISARNQQLDILVAQRTAELTEQKNELQNTVELLKATQDQLIQQEKLASLGELTAGIAHEIQNPLNFVNNFSEVSMELVDEMGEEFIKGDIEEAKAIANDIKQNLEKIIHHGKRADAIVKNMLQHSRSNSGEKQLTDINALADEYLRLSYHGLRAKDKMFNSNMVAELDPALPKLNVISQDIGRVLLNLFNNAFYAVQQRHNKEGDSYKPEVKVSTALKGKFIEIKVTDNGAGIPDEIKDKIMQPFFTTKPTGEGTGLGLSLSYDIITKGHGGEIDIDSKTNEFTQFKIILPVS